MNSAFLPVAVIAALPLLVAAASLAPIEVERLRRFAVGSALATLGTALLVAASPGLHTISIRTGALSWTPGGEALLRVDTLSSVLLPFAAGLWLLTVAVTPKAALDRGGLRRTALATAITLACFLTESALALLLLSVASVWTFLSALADPAHRYQRRIVFVYLGASTLLFAAGVALVIGPRTRGTALEAWGMWLIVAAALIRKGIVPFHAWVPEVFDHGRLGPAILFTAPQLGAYMTVVLIVPRASPDMLRLIAVLALGTTVYGAALALVQTSARRACGYLFMSQSALVMAGLDCTSASALAGGLLVWLSAGIAFAGLARCVLVLEARRGRLDLTTYHGGYDRMPLLAISFLAMGLACTGFPGTLGFVGEELLVKGAVEVFPIMGFAVVAASALTGLAVLRMYFSLFCGRADRRTQASVRLGLTPREAWTFVALVCTLVGLGVVPRPIVDSRYAAGDAILRIRQMRASGRSPAAERSGQLPASDTPKLYQQLTASPRFRAGENVQRLTAETAASSAAGPSLDRRSRLILNGWPVCDTRTRTITTSADPAARSPGSCGGTRIVIRGASSTSVGSNSRPAGASTTAARAGSTTGGTLGGGGGATGASAVSAASEAPAAATGSAKRLCCAGRAGVLGPRTRRTVAAAAAWDARGSGVVERALAATPVSTCAADFVRWTGGGCGAVCSDSAAA